MMTLLRLFGRPVGRPTAAIVTGSACRRSLALPIGGGLVVSSLCLAVKIAFFSFAILSAARLHAQPPVAVPSSPQLSEPRGEAPVDRRGRASLGIEIRDAQPRRGVTVLDVSPRSAGAAAGLQPGDRIVAFAGRLIRNADDLIREVSLRRVGDDVTLGVVRNDSIIELQTDLTPVRGSTPGPGQRSEDPAPPGSARSPGGVAEMPSRSNQPGAANPSGRPPSQNAGPNGGALGSVGSLLGGLFRQSSPPTAESSSDGRDGSRDANESTATRRAPPSSAGGQQGQRPDTAAELPPPASMDGRADGATEIQRIRSRISELEAELQQLRRRVDAMDSQALR